MRIRLRLRDEPMEGSLVGTVLILAVGAAFALAVALALLGIF